MTTKKSHRRNLALAFALLASMVLSLFSCQSLTWQTKEEKTFQDTVTALLCALDNRDEEAIYALFSPAVREKSENLKEQISALVALYQGPADAFHYDGPKGGGASFEKEGHIKNVSAEVPVRCGETYYWFYLDLIYDNTVDENQIGITQLEFFTADERCILEQYVEREGLYLHADAALDCEIRTIAGNPCPYTPSDKTIVLDEVKAFLEDSDSFAAFRERFGEPEAEDVYHYYQLPAEDGEPRYLCVGKDETNDRIITVSIEDDFRTIELVWERE